MIIALVLLLVLSAVINVQQARTARRRLELMRDAQEVIGRLRQRENEASKRLVELRNNAEHFRRQGALRVLAMFGDRPAVIQALQREKPLTASDVANLQATPAPPRIAGQPGDAELIDDGEAGVGYGGSRP